MWSLKRYALLALIIIMWNGILTKAAPTTNSTNTVNSTTSTTRTTSSTGTTSITTTIFDLPTNIDEDELLHQTALYMLDNMNLAVDPCENFYEYACGNWRNTQRVPELGHNDSFLHVIQTELNELMIEFLKNSTHNDNKTAEGKAKLLFNSCIMAGNDINLGIKTVMDSETKTFEKLKLNGKDDWIAINFMSSYGVYSLLPLNVNYSTNSRQFEISITLPMPLLETFRNFSKYEDLLDKMGPTAGQEVERNLTKGAKELNTLERVSLTTAGEFKLMLEFERNLTKKAKELDTLERVSLREFYQLHERDAINWKAVFKQAFGDNLQDDWYINNKISNFTDLERFLRKSPTENLRNYVKWRTLLKFYKIWKEEILGDETHEQICRQHTESYLSYALLPRFIDYLYDVERREDTLKIAESIQTHFFEMIDNYSWLDEETKSNVKTKLRAMDISVGYKDEMRHRVLTDQIYNDLNITSDWFKNLLNLEANRARMHLNSVRKTILPPMLSPYSVNAYYADYINTAFITMGISQMPLYHANFTASLKFGGIGMLIGHEIAHAFDSNGYLVDYDGKHYNCFSPSSLRNFKERYNCLENQYNKFIYRGIQTNATATMPDNIADNAGLRLAYHSYMKLSGLKEGLQKPLPALNFTNNELFFIKFTQTWCTGREDSYKMHHIKIDHHAYGEFRALGPLRNMHEFSETFKCKLGSQMNPLKKCIVW